MVRESDCSTSELINTLYTEIHQNYGEVRNFTSFLRTACTISDAKKRRRDTTRGDAGNGLDSGVPDRRLRGNYTC